jgi:hypothetical protein
MGTLTIAASALLIGVIAGATFMCLLVVSRSDD